MAAKHPRDGNLLVNFGSMNTNLRPASNKYCCADDLIGGLDMRGVVLRKGINSPRGAGPSIRSSW